MNRRTSVVTGILTATGLLVAGTVLGSGAAQAAPLAVQQAPAIGTGISGMLFPMKIESRVVAESTGDPQQVRFSAPNGPGECATTFSKALIRIDWRNQANGRVGSTTIKACPFGYNPEVPTSAIANTGPGRVAFTQVITGSRESATAGLPSTPGTGVVLR